MFALWRQETGQRDCQKQTGLVLKIDREAEISNNVACGSWLCISFIADRAVLVIDTRTILSTSQNTYKKNILRNHSAQHSFCGFRSQKGDACLQFLLIPYESKEE